ncbi:MAG: DNA polymerase III subunit delta, partial [Anaerococcus sp.]|nr:DNA polymerase III subunit delta [Anaerococcus sp.]
MIDLNRQINQNTLSHAYIFESANEEYNLDYALNFAKKIFENKGVFVDNDLNPDLYIIDKGKDIIDIQSIRTLLKDTALKPSNNIIKIYIIHNSHNMRTEGFNAML